MSSAEKQNISFPAYLIQVPFGVRFPVSYSLKPHGDMRVSGGLQAECNRDAFIAATNRRWMNAEFASTITRVRHSTHIEVIPPTGLPEYVEGDALIATRGFFNRLLGVAYADCFPIAMADIEAGVLSVVHASTKTVAGGILSKVVMWMEARGASRDHLCVYIGPGIRHYQSRRDDLPESFSCEHSSRILPDVKNAEFVQLDLLGIIQDKLKREGISDGNLIASRICTHCDPDFFSARREPTVAGQGLFMAALL